MDDPTADENPLVKLTSLAVLGVGLASLFLGYGNFWLVFALGFAVLVPMVKVVTEEFGVGDGSSERDRRTRDSTPRSAEPADRAESKQDALDTLRNRYARGELGEAEFERKVEALLETETPESARERVERTRTRDADETETPLEADERAN